jgi:tetratricopeptide (TPR) repeat protein
MRFFRVAVVSVFALCALTACPRRVPGPTEVLEEAAREARSGRVSARTLAFAGFHALLLESAIDQARTRFDAAVAADASEPWALYGQLHLALRAAQQDRAATIAMDLVERAPKHPLASVASRLLLDIAGEANALDDELARRVPGLLAAGAPGDAAHLLRSVLVTLALARGDWAALKQATRDVGAPTVATLVGPFSPWHRLSMAEPLAPEKTGRLDELGQGPFGPLVPRTLDFPDGRFSLVGEPDQGDVYLFAVDAQVPAAGVYVLRTVSAFDHVATVDGTAVLSRVTWASPAPTLTSRALRLSAGAHRILVRLARESKAGHFSLALQRLDGRPSGITWSPATGAAPAGWSGVETVDDAQGLFSSAESLRAALAEEAGDALARVVAARDALDRDRDGAWTLVTGLPKEVNGPTLAVLRADLSFDDRTVPSRVARGRAARDLEAALAKDPTHVHALLRSAQLALDDGRQLDALELLKRARAATPTPVAAVLALQARAELALGLDAQAVATAREAAEVLPGHCAALTLAYDVARRRDAVAEADALLAQAARCPGAPHRAAEHHRARGDVAKARAALEAQLQLDRSQVSSALALAGLLRSQDQYDEALKVLDAERARWPRNPTVLKALADTCDEAGMVKEALAWREAALLVDGADLSLRRLVERAKTGRELLDEYAISTEEALKSYEAAPGAEDATSTFVLDAAAIRVYPDGSMVDRVHIIQKALDQQGVQDIAEVQLPAGAEVLTLRTLKPDGRRLEPESIEGKDAVSLPGVQVGDLVEYEYLLAHPSRGPGQPGFTAGAFYFQIARQPNSRSTYVVVAPKGTGMKVDAHNIEAPPVVVEGEFEVFRHEERRVPPYIPEPHGPPSSNEWLPFVSVGAGQTGNEGVVQAYADAFLEHGQVSHEVRAFAKAAAGEAAGVDAVKAVYAAVMEKLSGRDAGLTLSAAASVAQDRGSRSWLLVSALKALGFDARLVAVRTFTADPSPYLFPQESLLAYLCVRVLLPDGRAVWLDPLVRYAPFGELPEFASGGREAYVFPEPGRPLEKVRTPASQARAPKEVRLTLTLSEDGVLSGDGEETYSGYDAAQMAEALESLPVDQRDQALQAALSRYFGGANLSNVKVATKREVGGKVKVTYHFVAPRFGRPEGDGRLVVNSLTYPHMLGRRFLATSSRVTPLFIEASEAVHTVATVTLPKGWSLASPLGEVELEGPAGRFVRREKQSGEVLHIEEDFRLEQARVAPKRYDDFARFAGELDLLQQRDLLIERG